MSEVTTVMDVGSSAARTVALAKARDARMEKYFGGGKNYRVDRPVDLPVGQVFQTPFGNKGRHGFIIVRQENGQDVIKEDGKPDACVFGITVLRRAAEMFPGCVEVPSVSSSKNTEPVAVQVSGQDAMSGADIHAPQPVPEGNTPGAVQNPALG